MSAQRPTIAAELVATMIEATPDRVRRRLDRTPDAAARWQWQADEQIWSVEADGETVTLPHGHLQSVEQVRCTCLLSPRCFHVLACVTHLEVIALATAAADEPAPVAPVPTSAEDLVAPDEPQQRAARELVNQVAQLLRVGVATAGVVVQSGLLRGPSMPRRGAAPPGGPGTARADGDPRVSRRAAGADPAQLAEDVADLLETGRLILAGGPIEGYWIGTARRKQLAVRPRKLHGLFAEPIVTRSGFAGAAVYFLGEDDRIYTASDVRPGEAQRARDAYLGGIEIGPLIQPAKQLARGLYLGTDLVASADGRLGRGKDVKVVEHGQSSWHGEAIQQRFRLALPEQWNAIYAQAGLPPDAHPAGWDFVFLDATILGAAGAELLVQGTADAQVMRLAIANESESLPFRENLRMLSHAPQLRLHVIGRVNLQEPRVVFPLAIAPSPSNHPVNDGAPRLEVPTALAGRVCLGFDAIQSKHLVHARPSPVVVNVPHRPADSDQPLGPLRRRWVAALLAGITTHGAGNANLLAAETALLVRGGFATGAALLDSLTRA